jgi:exodeoxyribonuclease-3
MKKGFVDWLRDESPDVICIQETKANKDQVDFDLIEKLGYKTYWFSAQKKGYSGVAYFF